MVNDQTPKTHFNEEWLKNLTTPDVPKDVKMMLALGPKFAVYQTKYKVPINRIIADVEHIISDNNGTEIQNLIRVKASNIIPNHIYSTEKHMTSQQLSLRNAYRSTNIFLKNNPHITIAAADKGNVLILMY